MARPSVNRSSVPQFGGTVVGAAATLVDVLRRISVVPSRRQGRREGTRRIQNSELRLPVSARDPAYHRA